jgi:hypothetical protein
LAGTEVPKLKKPDRVIGPCVRISFVQELERIVFKISESHDFMERASCAARRRRMREIVLELSSLIREVSPQVTVPLRLLGRHAIPAR